MAEEKEPFLARWSRLKHESKEPEKVEEKGEPAVLPPVENLQRIALALGRTVGTGSAAITASL